MEQLGYIETPQNLDAIFSALADPTRRSILSRLTNGEASVKELAEPFNISQPAISKHLRVLEKAGLIERDIDKQRRPARLNAKNMAVAVDFLNQFKTFWNKRFDQLDKVLLDLNTEEKHDKYP
ncbi:MAG: winged helix-turn-helix transcriptional regulator [Alphaproteobacteria bacterium]|nr:winged helix-turn-helix transcriptional regulator [Alphaproteobacteria bacterium]HPF45367.1 metalloregulator ArsR/SmtB family transcription factor [Emcibacteraceae bacterium]HRW29837.1 metalloregulator ArsR/SmtB family transcription factor [Emcibacteraceae bacterium]